MIASTPPQPSSEILLHRLDLIKQNLGRPLRVLHIGNIANNAYLNSKLLNEFGAESHVLSYDYYHVMGTPEWEDAFFDSSQINHFYPEWKTVDLNGFVRPDWFVQGPLDICLQYLQSYQLKDEKKLPFFRWQLSGYNRTKRPPIWSMIRHPASLLKPLLESFLRIGRVGSVTDDYFYRFPKQDIGKLSWQAIAARSFAVPIYATALIFKRTKLIRLFDRWQSDPQTDLVQYDNAAIGQKLIEKFQRHFPDRTDSLKSLDFRSIRPLPRLISTVFKYYDVIHAYATDPTLPLVLGLKNYVAYEHGTIRTLPFVDQPLARMTALAYAEASAIIGTNADCYDSAIKLQPDQKKIVRGLHGFDERQVKRRLAHARQSRTSSQARFNIPDDVTLFLHPARQDWSIKGNHILLEAIMILKSRRSELRSPFSVVLADWGNDANRARTFIQKNGIDDFVQWTDILSKTHLIHAVSEADAIVDQFLIPCIGAVPPEFLTVSKGPLITYLDEAMMERFYGKSLPVLNAKTAENVAAQMMKVINKDPIVGETTKKSKEWVAERHSHLNVLAGCLDAYDQALSRSSSEGHV